MIPFRKFISRHLDPQDRLGEVLFGLIMALGFTGAVRLGVEEPDNRELFFSILGCNIAWGIVDGVMYAMTSLFERGRKARVFRGVSEAKTEAEAFARIGKELNDRLEPLTSEEERRQIYGWIAKVAARQKWSGARIQKQDLLGATAVALAIIVATIPVVVPFLLFSDGWFAARCSNIVALSLLFLLGMWWGKTVGISPWRIGAGLTAVGMALVGITIALGG